MAPKKKTKNRGPSADPNGIFAGMSVLLVETGVQNRRLQVWKQKLVQMGATIEERLYKKVSHVFAVDLNSLLQQLDRERLARFKGSVLLYQWLEDSLSSGEKVSEDLYRLKLDLEEDDVADKSLDWGNAVSGGEPLHHKKIKSSNEDMESSKAESKRDGESNAVSEKATSPISSDSLHDSPSAATMSLDTPSAHFKDPSLPYSPPDLNKNITEIFGKLINIYRAMGEDRRSFSYHKAILVIEKLPFKIESADQVKGLPGIGKSMHDHIQEIVTTGKLSKLEHFETDEKVRTISLFGEVWGIGPATAQKLYEKGHRTLDDLKREDSLTQSQRIGLKYFDDIKTRIPRHEVQEMELLLQKAGKDILPGVVILCGGSFRRGKASCGDLDIVITHPDGKSHKGFLSRFVKRLKDMNFLREDLVFSTHSEEGTDSGVDTYFGLCTYPGRELRHRIDFKVYPRDIYAFGLIAWTGNDVLNRRLRLLAESKGYRLDDTGLFPATHGSGGKQIRKRDTETQRTDMASWSKALLSSTLDSSPPIFSSPSPPISLFCNSPVSSLSLGGIKLTGFSTYPSISGKIQPTLFSPSFSFKNHICRAAEYEFPDPIPEFADAETEKFRTHLLNKLAKKDMFGDSLEEVVGICTEIFGTFLHTEYGGPGTLLVTPFVDMADTLNEQGLPGGPQAARAAVVWAQNHVDKDWKEWTGDSD